MAKNLKKSGGPRPEDLQNFLAVGTSSGLCKVSDTILPKPQDVPQKKKLVDINRLPDSSCH